MQTLPMADGCRLHVEQTVTASSPRAHVLLVHGLGEHLGRYGWLVQALASAGLVVTAYDHRGHGQSDGPRGALPEVDALLHDLGRVVEQARSGPWGHLPLLLLGHSMGGLVTARFVAEGLAVQPAGWWQPLEGLMLSSPALDIGMTPVQKALVALLCPVWPTLALGNGLDPQWVSRDPAVVQAYRSDPLVHDRITPRLARFFLQAGAATLAAAPRWTMPTLLLYAGADRCVAPRGSDALAATTPPNVLTAKRYDGLAHEIFNEPERAQVLADLMRWLEALLPRLSLASLVPLAA